MASRNSRRRRRNRGGTGGGALPGPSQFKVPTAQKDSGNLYVAVRKPEGLPTHLNATHFSVTLKGAAGQQLLHGSKCANTWTTGKVAVGTWSDVYVQTSTKDVVAVTSMVWYDSS
jgi:hypothetical protein